MKPDARVKAAQREWPNGSVSAAAFALRLAQLEKAGEVGFPTDLYWSLCCLAGDDDALEALQRAIEAQLRRRPLEPQERDELARTVMEVLVIGRGTPPEPRLAQYAGRSPLDGWLHVVVTRLVLDAKRSQKGANETSAEDAMLGGFGEALPPEVELAREQYRGVFAAAFRAALQRLEPKQRLLLRQHYLDGVSLEALAKLHAAGRSTVARWLQAARLAVMDAMRDEVRRTTGMTAAQIESLLKVVKSRLEVSMSLLISGE